MNATAGALMLRGIQAGLAGAVALAVVLALVAPPPSAVEERARREANEALARSGLTPVGDPVVAEQRSLFEEPGRAILLALGCAATGVLVGLALGVAASRRGSGLSSQLVPVVSIGALLTFAGLTATGFLRTRELLAFGAFWAVTATAVLLGDRAPRRRRPA